jgi:membrane protein YdbS with pleckstrin-like domain
VAQASSNVGGHGATLKSWLVCLVILAGFVIGGIAVVYWNWPLFWAGVAVAVIGCVVGWAVGIMDDVTEYGGGGAGHDPGSASY